MTPYKLMPAAEDDLTEIVTRISFDSPRDALKGFDAFHDAAHKLAAMPLMGHMREDVTDKPVRFWSVYSWLIVYRPDREPIEILRIIHGARNLPKRLRLE